MIQLSWGKFRKVWGQTAPEVSTCALRCLNSRWAPVWLHHFQSPLQHQANSMARQVYAKRESTVHGRRTCNLLQQPQNPPQASMLNVLRGGMYFTMQLHSMDLSIWHALSSQGRYVYAMQTDSIDLSTGNAVCSQGRDVYIMQMHSMSFSTGQAVCSRGEMPAHHAAAPPT